LLHPKYPQWFLTKNYTIRLPTFLESKKKKVWYERKLLDLEKDLFLVIASTLSQDVGRRQGALLRL
jgi:hypothetical protein